MLIALGAGLATPLSCFAQPQGQIRRIGALAFRSRSTPSNPEVFYDSFMRGLRDLGYVEGKNLVIEWRFADGKYERLPDLAGELVRLNVEVIATHSTPATDALKRATGTIPIVNAAFGDPVARGFAASLARPGGNITGLSLMNIDLAPKRFELLKLMNPALSRAAVLTNSGSPGHSAVLKSVKAVAQKLGVAVLPVDARTPEEIERGQDGKSARNRRFAGAFVSG